MVSNISLVLNAVLNQQICKVKNMKRNLAAFKIIAVILFIFFPAFHGFAQADIAAIRNSGNYYWGTGTGANYNEARQNALASLSESIQVEIKHNFETVVREVNGNLEEYVRSVVTTYSSAILRDYETKVLKEEPGKWEVMVYISKQKLEDYYRILEQSINDYIYNALRAERDLRIADALRYYYWALLLTRGHPDNEKLRNTFGGYAEEALYLGLQDRINSMLSAIYITITAVRTFDNPVRKEVDLQFTYQNKRIQDLDYTYWIGDGFSGLMSAGNGIGVVTFDGDFTNNLRSIRFLIEYQYRNKAETERNVNRMFENIDLLPFFSKAERNVPIISGQPGLVVSTKRTPHFQKIGSGLPEFEKCKLVVDEVLEAIREKNYPVAQKNFTTEGYAMFQKLIAGGNVTVLDQQMDTLQMVKVGNQLMVRSVPMLFAYHNSRERFVEHVVFTFDESQQISSLSFALGDVAISDIVNKPTGFGTLEEKYFLINFMENYKTAFALKRLDYIESIFSDDALIIVGHVVKKAPDAENPWLNNEIVKFNTYTKQQYISNLAANFRRNEFINIRFEENTVRKTERDDKIYGIQIAQHYYSSTYADKGFLFLMIDLNDTINPKIYVRTWQPDKNPDGSIYGLEDFRF